MWNRTRWYRWLTGAQRDSKAMRGSSTPEWLPALIAHSIYIRHRYFFKRFSTPWRVIEFDGLKLTFSLKNWNRFISFFYFATHFLMVKGFLPNIWVIILTMAKKLFSLSKFHNLTKILIPNCRWISLSARSPTLPVYLNTASNTWKSYSGMSWNLFKVNNKNSSSLRKY